MGSEYDLGLIDAHHRELVFMAEQGGSAEVRKHVIKAVKIFSFLHS